MIGLQQPLAKFMIYSEIKLFTTKVSKWDGENVMALEIYQASQNATFDCN